MASSGKVAVYDETRKKKRFSFAVPLAAHFGTYAVDLLDISLAGAQIRHNDPLPIGKEASLSVEVPGTSIVVPLKSRVRWSRLSGRSDGLSVYRSGLALAEERVDLISDLVDQLVRTKKATFDAASLDKKRDAMARKAERTLSLKKESWHVATSAAEQLDQVRKARMFLRNNPVESHKWSNRARYSLNAKQKETYTLEMLTVWEFLGRDVDLTVIDLAFKLG